MSRETPFVDFPAGSTMLREGEAAGAIFIIEAGRAAIERNGAVLADLGPGDVFGEAALLQEQGHAANAVARTAVRALRLETATLPAVLRENVDVGMQLMRRLVQRLRAAETSGALAAAGASRSAAQPIDAAASKASSAPAGVPVPPVATNADSGTGPPVSPAPVLNAPPTPAAVDTRARSEPMSPAAPAAPAPTAQAVPAAPAVIAHVLRHAQGVIAVPADKAECLVGRPDPATGAIPEINLGPLDLARSLSRRHARLLATGNTVSLREEPGVANGTWVNGERLAAGQVVILKPGDKLRFGAIELEFGTA